MLKTLKYLMDTQPQEPRSAAELAAELQDAVRSGRCEVQDLRALEALHDDLRVYLAEQHAAQMPDLSAVAFSAAEKAAWCQALALGSEVAAAPLWLLKRRPEEWQALSEGFEALHLAAARLHVRLPRPEGALLQHAATVQSGLRGLLLSLGGQIDAGQVSLFRWLTSYCREQRIYLPQHLSAQRWASLGELHSALLALRAMPAQPRETGPEKKKSAAPLREQTAAVILLREYLAGKTVLMVGSDVENQDHIRICAEAGIRVRWRNFKHSESHFNVESDLRQDDVKVVVMVVKLTSHDTALIKPLCDQHNRDFVRLPAGYGLNVLAHEIMAQVGG